MDDRHERLARIAPNQDVRVINQGYSKFIRIVRLVLPVIAIVLIGVIFSWNSFDDSQIEPISQDIAPVQNVGKNELLSPKFESVDDKGQPYTITAERAIQGEADEDLLTLESPVGEMILERGNVVSMRSDHAEYRQNSKKLLMQDHVVLTHDDGYQMDTEVLHIDMNASTARSDVDVFAKGPEGTIEAKGLQGSSVDEVLVFIGPAKMVLDLESDDASRDVFGFGGLTP